MRLAYGDRVHLPGISNGGRIAEFLYRGAQPRAEGLQELKKLGVTTIVDLRKEDPEKRAWEKQQAESLGMKFVSIPVDGWSPPSDDQLAQFLGLFHNTPREKVYVHCRFGDDRTGVFVASYRMAYEGWPPQEALNEMYFFGFNGFWHPSMKVYIHDFPARLRAAPSLATFVPRPGQLPSGCVQTDKSEPSKPC